VARVDSVADVDAVRGMYRQLGMMVRSCRRSVLGHWREIVFLLCTRLMLCTSLLLLAFELVVDEQRSHKRIAKPFCSFRDIDQDEVTSYYYSDQIFRRRPTHNLRLLRTRSDVDNSRGCDARSGVSKPEVSNE
jgi:hypothetical protein